MNSIRRSRCEILATRTGQHPYGDVTISSPTRIPEKKWVCSKYVAGGVNVDDVFEIKVVCEIIVGESIADSG